MPKKEDSWKYSSSNLNIKSILSFTLCYCIMWVKVLLITKITHASLVMIVDMNSSCLCMSYGNSTLWICVMDWNQEGKMCHNFRKILFRISGFLGVISFPVLLTLHECAACFYWIQQPTDDPAEALESWFPRCCLNRYNVMHIWKCLWTKEHIFALAALYPDSIKWWYF